MGIELIKGEDHQHLLEKIDKLPFGDEHAGLYRASLEELFVQFNGQLKELFHTIKAYREVADLINKRQPLSGKNKQRRVRIRKGKGT
jgi:hypothetical protein